MSMSMSASTLGGGKSTFVKILLACLLNTVCVSAYAQRIDYTKADSLRVVHLLQEAKGKATSTNFVLFFARRFRGIPYVAQTLERNDLEQLVVNLRQLDCTTYVETVLSLAACVRHGKYTFEDYCQQLRALRYAGGKISYGTRLHYFSAWIESNQQGGLVKNIDKPLDVFSCQRKLDVYYMTRHIDQYPMLVSHREYIPEIKQMEQKLTGRTYWYLPKQSIANTKVQRDAIHDGDVIVILTNKKGLDASHIGIAVWHKDGLHMLNASSIHHKVVEEPMTLRRYMSKHPSQIGIRIVRPH